MCNPPGQTKAQALRTSAVAGPRASGAASPIPLPSRPASVHSRRRCATVTASPKSLNRSATSSRQNTRDAAQLPGLCEMAEPLTLKAISEAIISFWGRSALLLWCIALCSIAALGVLLAGKYFQIDRAAELFHDYGMILALAGVLLLIGAAFKTYDERPKPNIVLLPREDRSAWAQTLHREGNVTTQFSVHFQATNVSDGTIKLAEITLRRPWVRRRSILTRVVLFDDPKSQYYSSAHPVPAHTLTYGSATIVVDHAVGRKGKPIRLVVALRDHTGRWHKLVFPIVRYFGSP
jgi:hypothetical protein